MADTHGNDFRRVVQLTLTQDVHCFFAADCQFRYWRPVERRHKNNNGPQSMTVSHMSVVS